MRTKGTQSNRHLRAVPDMSAHPASGALDVPVLPRSAPLKVRLSLVCTECEGQFESILLALDHEANDCTQSYNDPPDLGATYEILPVRI